MESKLQKEIPYEASEGTEGGTPANPNYSLLISVVEKKKIQEIILPDLFACGSLVNLYNAAGAMGTIACPLAGDDELESDESVAYNYFKDNTEHTVMTDAPPAVRQSVEMDIALRDTIARCMATAFVDGPSLQEVLAEAEDKVANRGPDDDPDLEEKMGVDESDRYIRQFVERFIYNASNR
ncbi:hypothetical protein F4680DRAFT_443578 [Xylaria scruposa]|nr:hypothetical protein F4680DRAFT_443578 [Xylaria scruposa]